MLMRGMFKPSVTMADATAEKVANVMAEAMKATAEATAKGTAELGAVSVTVK
jgi:hypothetical protein